MEACPRQGLAEESTLEKVLELWCRCVYEGRHTSVLADMADVQESGSWSMGVSSPSAQKHCVPVLQNRTATTLGQPGPDRSVQEGLRSLCGRTWQRNLTHESSKPMGFTVFSKGCAH